jgi:bifunctional non-homologous end joining protein LigD
MLAHSADELPQGRDWTYEVKWDGYRAIAAKDGNRVKLMSRNQKDLTRDYPTIATAVAALSTPSVQLDGEIVAIDASGRPSFQALQHRSTKGLSLVFVAFDVLTIGGESLLKQPLDARRRRLRSVFAGAPPVLMLSESLPGSPAQIETEIRKLGLEGVIAKRGNSLYLPGQRSPAWVKVKFSPRQEFVVGGYKPGASEFESLVVGYYDEHKKLRYAAKVRAGVTAHMKAEVFKRIVKRPARRCPFADLPNSTGYGRWGQGVTEEDMAKLRWVTPSLVVDVAFVEWTRDGLLRHPRLIGVRDDKNAKEVVREPREGDGVTE